MTEHLPKNIPIVKHGGGSIMFFEGASLQLVCGMNGKTNSFKYHLICVQNLLSSVKNSENQEEFHIPT